ncbi:hypothetical protein WG66_005973 [Moniliophthora roreri]|nr:hypothetical protein WG66_005973 [Moniliophthora roreri]
MHPPPCSTGTTASRHHVQVTLKQYKLLGDILNVKLGPAWSKSGSVPTQGWIHAQSFSGRENPTSHPSSPEMIPSQKLSAHSHLYIWSYISTTELKAFPFVDEHMSRFQIGRRILLIYAVIAAPNAWPAKRRVVTAPRGITLENMFVLIEKTYKSSALNGAGKSSCGISGGEEVRSVPNWPTIQSTDWTLALEGTRLISHLFLFLTSNPGGGKVLGTTG